MKSYGLNLKKELQDRTPDDWKFGSFSQTCIAAIPEAEREQYLPQGEIQRGLEDMEDCTTRAPINELEQKLTYLYESGKMHPENKAWLEEKGYIANGRVSLSDAFISIQAGTTREGNSFKAPLEIIRTKGVIPKSMLPLLPEMTFDDYYNRPITFGMTSLGQEFLRRFSVNYERVYKNYFPALLKQDLLCTGGYAWSDPINGEYPASDLPPNHEFLSIRTPSTFIFDNYVATPQDGNTFIKKLASNYNFVDVGYRLYISKESVVTSPVTSTVISGNDRSIFLQILQKLAQILQIDLLLTNLRGLLKGRR